jgi:hypothetical protein
MGVSIISLHILFLTLVQYVTAAPAAHSARGFFDPAVTITHPEATIVGLQPQILSLNTEQFLGIPYALPPTNSRRLNPPMPITNSMGTVMAQANGNVCPQMVFSNDFSKGIPTAALEILAETPFLQKATSQSEDCLQLSVRFNCWHMLLPTLDGSNLLNLC